MNDQMTKLLAASSSATGAAGDMIEAVRDGQVSKLLNVGSGETATSLADSLRLLLEATTGTGDDAENQLHGALIRFLEDRI